MARTRQLVKRHPVAIYFALAYAITWSGWFPIAYAYDRGLIEISPQIIVLYVLASFGPLVAAGLVTFLSGGSVWRWFRQALLWRVAPRWWLAALGVPLALYAVMAGVHLLLGGTFNTSEVASLATVPGTYLSIFLWGGGNEELGWRGLALPYLQERYSAVTSSLLIGVVWTVWHAPSGIVELGLRGWALDLPIYAVIVIGISIVATWLYNSSGGSVLLTMVFHAGVNGAQALYPVEGMFTTTGEFARFAAWAIVVAVILIIYGPARLSRGTQVPTSVHAGAPAENGAIQLVTSQGQP